MKTHARIECIKEKLIKSSLQYIQKVHCAIANADKTGRESSNNNHLKKILTRKLLKKYCSNKETCKLLKLLK